MSIPYTSGDFTKPRANGNSRIEYPFIKQGDNVTKIYHIECTVNHADYAPIALDVAMTTATAAGVLELPFTADADAYCVGDYNINKNNGCMTSFTRKFANIPTDRDKILTGTTSHTFPSFTFSQDVTTVAATGFIQNPTPGVTRILAPNNISVGDVCRYSFNTSHANGSTIVTSGTRTAITGTNSTGVNFSLLPAFPIFDSGSIGTFAFQPRGGFTVPTGTFSKYSYYLPGVTTGITDVTDIPLGTIYAPSALPLSQQTIPTPEAYKALVTAGDLLTVSSEITTYMGNIAQRVDHKVKAQ